MVFIGSAIYKDFKNSKIQIIPTSRNLNGLGKDFIKLDVFNENTWSDLLDGYKPNIVIFTAWGTEHLEYRQKSINFNFAKAIKNFTNACFISNVSHFIGLESCSEYGYSPGKCNSKKTPLNPQDPYSEAKVMASIELELISNNYGKKQTGYGCFNLTVSKKNLKD
jgi:nucleoside-diphosphate-sugar epimerase